MTEGLDCSGDTALHHSEWPLMTTYAKTFSLLLTLPLIAWGPAVAAEPDGQLPSTTWAQMRSDYPARTADACAAVRTRATKLSTTPARRAMAESITRAACECLPRKIDRLLGRLATEEPGKRVSPERRSAFNASAFEQCKDDVPAPSLAFPPGDEGKFDAIQTGFLTGCLTLVVSRELTPRGPERAAADLLVENKCDCFVPEMDRSLRALVVSSKGGPIAGDDLFAALRAPTQSCGARMIRGTVALCSVIPDRTLAGLDQPAYCACLTDGIRSLSDGDLLPSSSFTVPGSVTSHRPVTNPFNGLDATCRARAAPADAAPAAR